GNEGCECLEQMPSWLSRHALQMPEWSHVLFGKPVSTFPGHALEHIPIRWKRRLSRRALSAPICSSRNAIVPANAAIEKKRSRTGCAASIGAAVGGLTAERRH